MSTSTPTFLYKIVSAATPPPEPLPEYLPVSELDQKDSFIHLSTSKQIAGTLGRFFASEDMVWILKLKYATVGVGDSIKWEDSVTGAQGAIGEPTVFPHLYNGLRLGKNEVESAICWERTEEETWDDVASKATSTGWLVY